MNLTAAATFTTTYPAVDTSDWSNAMAWIYIVAAVIAIVSSVWIAFFKK